MTEDEEFKLLELRQEREAANRDAGMRGLIKEELAAEPQQPYAYERDGSFIPAWHCTEPPPRMGRLVCRTPIPRVARVVQG